MKANHMSLKRSETIFPPRELALACLLGLLTLSACQRSSHRTPLPVLTSVHEVLGLSSEKAEFGYPVRLEGLVTYVHKGTNTLILQGPTGSIFVDTTQTNFTVETGTKVVLEGFTRSGDPSSVIVNPSLRILGQEKMPRAPKVTASELKSGNVSYQWVEFEGVVGSASLANDGCLLLDLTADGQRVSGRVVKFEGLDHTAIVGTKVRVQGVSQTIFDIRRRPIRLQLLVPDLRYVQVEDSSFRLKGASLQTKEMEFSSSSASQKQSLPLLTSVRQVHSLASDEAKRHYPVRLRALLTYYDSAWKFAFVQDQTGGIFIDSSLKKDFELESGQIVFVEGESGPGEFAPVITHARLQLQGHIVLPKPSDLPLEELFSGRQDSNWIRAEGIVQSVAHAGRHFNLSIASGLYRFRAIAVDKTIGELPGYLVDARVRVSGVCGALFNSRKQLVGIQVFLPSLNQLEIMEPAPSDPFSMPARPVDSLLQFNPNESIGHRMRLKGVVTLQQPSGSLFIQDETGGVQVQTAQNTPVERGDRVDVLGFAITGDYTPILQNASYRKISSGPAPSPVLITAEEALAGSYDSQLVQIEAQIMNHSSSSTQHVLSLQSGKLTFNAILAMPSWKVRRGATK